MIPGEVVDKVGYEALGGKSAVQVSRGWGRARGNGDKNGKFGEKVGHAALGVFPCGCRWRGGLPPHSLLSYYAWQSLCPAYKTIGIALYCIRPWRRSWSC